MLDSGAGDRGLIGLALAAVEIFAERNHRVAGVLEGLGQPGVLALRRRQVLRGALEGGLGVALSRAGLL